MYSTEGIIIELNGPFYCLTKRELIGAIDMEV